MSCQRSRFADAAASGCYRSADQTNIPVPSAAIPPANRCCRDQLQPSPICKCVRPFGNPLRSVKTGLQNTLEVRTRATLQNRISTPKPKNDDFEALLKGIFKGKSSAHISTKIKENLLPKLTPQLSYLSCSHYNTI